MAAARRRLRELLTPALDRLAKNIDDEEGWVSTKAIGQVLQYTDIKGPEKVEHRVVVYDPEKYKDLTDEELEALAAIARKLVASPDRGDPGGDPKAGAA